MPIIRTPPEWGIEPVPKKLRQLGLLDYTVLWSSLGIGLLVMQAGALLVQWLQLSLIEALIITIIGSIIGSFLLALVGVIGSKYGLPTMVSLRPIFGKYGTYLPTILNIVQLIGWTTFEFIIMGEAATVLTGEFMGLATKYLWITVFALWCYLLAVLGPLAVVREWLEKFAIWLVFISSIWITFQLLNRLPSEAFSPSGSPLSNFLLGLDLVVAMPISWIPLVSDYNRFAKDKSKSFWGTFIGYTIANSWFYMLGAALAYLYPGESVVYSIALLFLGSFALFIVLVDETDNAFADIYSAAVSIGNILPKVKQWKTSLIITLVSLGLAYFVPIARYEDFLLLIGASFIPLFSVLLAEYFVIRGEGISLEEFFEKAPKLSLRNIVSWVFGFIVYYYLTYIHTEPPIGGSLITIVLTFIFTLLLSKIKH